MNLMPRLTETLPHREPGRCASCGAIDPNAGTRLPLYTVWREHDEQDRPEPRFVVLCRPCGDRLIEPHPRLYAALPANAPAIGAMPLCLACRHREGTACRNPLAKANGGPGMPVDIDPPGTMHVNRGGGGRNYWTKVYTRPARSCAGHEPAAGKGEP